MALPVRDQLKYWGIVTAASALALWFLGDVLLPFVLGGAIAYFIDPVADWLERAGLSRTAATGVITGATLVGFVLAVLLFVPMLINQLVGLIQIFPDLMNDLQAFLIRNFPSALVEGSTLNTTLDTLADKARASSLDLLETALASAMSAINVLILLVIVPVVAVYLLVDWDRMIAEIDQLIPRDYSPAIRLLASQIDQVLSAFIRGMGTVCVILGVYYAVALMAVGLQFGLIVGVIAGLVTFIPYLGAIIGGALAIGLALFQFWGDWASIGMVAGVFVIGQVVEGNFLTPRLVGSSVGLHPVWLLFALSVFGSLFGFVGMLVAVPLAAAMGVIARFGVGQYLQSRLYKGESWQDEVP